MQRIMTVYSRMDNNRKENPEIKIYNRFLSESKFQAGDKILITYSDNQIIINKLNGVIK